MNQGKVTIRDILQSPYFKNAQLIAGASEIDRPVKWIHILDAYIFNSLTGNEFILSTGSVFTNLEKGISFLKHLIERKVSGLCIELVEYITSVPEEMIQIANENNFPLVILTESVNFIEVTLEWHTKIITQNAVSFNRIEKYSEKLNQILLSPHDIEDILDSIQVFLGLGVAYIPQEGKNLFCPSPSLAEQKRLASLFCSLIQTEDTGHGLNLCRDNLYIACRHVAAIDRKLGDVLIYSNESLKDLDILILEKAVLAIAQDMLRDLFIKEKRMYKENIWLKDWLTGKLKEREIYQLLEGNAELEKVSGYNVFMIEFNKKIDLQKNMTQFMIHTTIFLRPLFEQEGFIVLGTYENNKIIYALFDRDKRETWKPRIMRVISQFKARRNALSKGGHIIVGVGRISDRITEISKSYQTALESIGIQKKLQRDEPLYDFLHVYRIISQVDKMGNLDEYIYDYLAPLIQYDQEHNGDLIKTLQVYFECNGSKQKTAERLFIVRQTLYLRIEKLEELLGKDFMHPEKRLAIEIALYAYQFNKEVGIIY
ncbi:MAG: PucR family transcriptional regulator [Dehalobacterium sp.]